MFDLPFCDAQKGCSLSLLGHGAHKKWFCYLHLGCFLQNFEMPVTVTNMLILLDNMDATFQWILASRAGFT